MDFIKNKWKIVLVVLIALIASAILFTDVGKKLIKLGDGGDSIIFGEIDESKFNKDGQNDLPEEESKEGDYGVNYIRKNIETKGISLLLPDRWTDNTRDGILYLKEGKENSSAEIAIHTTSGIPTNKENIRKGYADYVFNELTYNHGLGLFNILSYYDMDLEEIRTDEDVWLDTSSAEYYRERSNNDELTSYAKVKRLVGFKHSKNNILNEVGSPQNTGDTWTTIYFIPFNQTEMAIISVIAPSGYKDKVEDIAYTIAESFKTLNSNYARKIPSLNDEITVGNINIVVPGDSVVKVKNNRQYWAVLSDDISSPFFNISISVNEFTSNIKNDDEFVMDISRNKKITSIPLLTNNVDYKYVSYFDTYPIEINKTYLGSLKVMNTISVHRYNSDKSVRIGGPREIMSNTTTIKSKEGLYYLISITYPKGYDDSARLMMSQIINRASIKV